MQEIIIYRNIYLLSNKKHPETLSLPIIKFIPICNKISFNNVDTILFSSKNGVKFLNDLNSEWHKYKIISIGKSTTEYINKYSQNIIYSNNQFYGKDLADYIYQNFFNNKILYIRPKIVSFNFKNYLKNYNLDIQEKIIYETKCIEYSKNYKPKKNSIIIFTSPSTIKCFIRNFEWDKSFFAIVIGKTTEEYIPTYIKYILSTKPSIEECINEAKIIRQLLKLPIK